MPEHTFPYITRPATQGNTITTMPKYRGTKTQAQLYAEIAARLGSTPLTIAIVILIQNQIIIDWTIAGWKIEALGDGLIGYLAGCGGSSPIGQDPPQTFEEMGLDLRGHYGAAGRARAQAAFSAEKVGEQNRVTPVFVEVYDSETKTHNHYVAGKALTLVLGNRNPKFDPTQTGQMVRFQKADGTFVNASGYPYIKGNTIVATVPTGLTGAIELHLTLRLNDAIRTGIYPFPLT